MLRLSTFCMLLALAVAQNGYEYSKPNRPFGQGTSSSRPGTSPGSSIGTTTTDPIRTQTNDFSGPARKNGYPTGPQNYPGSSSQRPGYQGSTYSQGPSGPTGYQGQTDAYPGSRGPPGFSGPGSKYPESGSSYPGQNPNYSGQPGLGPVGFVDDTGNYEGGDYSAIPGQPDIDYPVLSYIPQTSFICQSQPYPGYYADVETRCQVFHVCSNNKTYDFLCPNGTVFSQEVFVCVWWNEFSCEDAPNLYELNAQIYDYSYRESPSNFNDYQGSSYPGNGGSQGTTSQRPSNYPGSGPQGSSTPYPGRQGSYPSAQMPGSYPGSQGPSNSYPGAQGTSGSYPANQGSLGSYPGSQGPAGSYPGPQGSSNSYPGSQGPSGSYSGPQDPSGSYPGSQNSANGYPGSDPSGPQGLQGPPGSQGKPGYPGSGPNSSYPGSGSGTAYSGSGPGNQGYPSGRPSVTGYQPGSNGGRPSQKPNREYLPPRN